MIHMRRIFKMYLILRRGIENGNGIPHLGTADQLDYGFRLLSATRGEDKTLVLLSAEMAALIAAAL